MIKWLQPEIYKIFIISHFFIGKGWRERILITIVKCRELFGMQHENATLQFTFFPELVLVEKKTNQ